MSSKADHSSPEEDVVVHEYDDIQECDNQLPRWWLYSLFGTCIFAASYWLYYHSYARAPLPNEEYAAVKAEQLAKEAEELKAAGEMTPELLVKLSKDPGTVDQGAKVFATTCVTCHADGGKGNIGPNLTDDFWIHGANPDQIYKTVKDGFLEKQMPAWGKQLGEAKTRSVVAYVLTIKGTNVAGGKPPQGDKAQ